MSDNASRVVLSNAWSSALVVPAAQIEKRLPVLPSPKPGSAWLKPPSESNTTALQYGILVPPIPKPEPVRKWSVQAEAGVDLQYSTRDREAYFGRAKAEYGRERLRASLDYLANYGRSENDLNADNMSGAGKVDFDVSRRWFFYNMAGAGYDKVRRIKMDFEEGPGIGYHLFQGEALKANAELGFNYYAEYRMEDTDQSTFSTRLAETATWTVAKRVSLEQRTEFFPRLNDPSQYRLRFEGTLRLWLTTHLSLNLSMFDTFDTSPALGVPENDLQIRSSIGVKY